ncbi:MAG: DUF1957 domain-containing protein [Candidatus Aureabacteria bacterium]|nr:DUF1957 domain-containing protein [Candidatus Auribacterota bacterium]
MEIGYFSLVLHTHLPYVRHPEHAFHLEEDWLFEAITETYLPLLKVFHALEKDQIPFRITMSLTPPLLAMLKDPLLQERYIAHLKRLIALAEKELERTLLDSLLNKVAQFYHTRLLECEHLYIEEYQCDLVSAFRHFQDIGCLEIISSAATHGFLPLLNVSPEAVRAQVQTAVEDYERYFNRSPGGFWLPECGYYPGLDEVLKNSGIRFFFLDAHALLYGNPRPRFGMFSAVRCPSGIFAFGRDIETSKIVWSKEDGYPGDGYYREFYRDIGYDLDWEYISPFFPDGNRKNTGLKYYRITDRGSHNKMIYEPSVALERAESHALHFLSSRVAQVRELFKELKKRPIIVSMYDTELFGHWWFEGIAWLDLLIRKMAAQDEIKMILPHEYLEENPVHQTITPSQSSWGDRGYHEFWLNEKNDWMYRHLHQASFRMVELARAFAEPSPLEKRALNQAARELLLAQASDWAFIMRTGTMVSYADKRVHDHLARFHRLYRDLMNKTLDVSWIEQVELRDDIFPGVNYRVYA